MRITFRLIVSLISGVTLVAFMFTYLEVKEEKRGMREELQRRAEVLAESLEATVSPLVRRQADMELRKLVEEFGQRERLAGVAIYSAAGNLEMMTPGLDPALMAPPPAVQAAITEKRSVGGFITLGSTALYVYAVPLEEDRRPEGFMALYHDASYIDKQTTWLWWHHFANVLVEVLMIVLLTLLIVRWSVTGPIARTARWMKELRTRGAAPRPDALELDLFKPLADEVTHLAHSLSAARAAAEKEAILRQAAETLWTAERLRVHVRNKLGRSPLFVISNREPYMHVHRGGAVEMMVPASGLVTALEPILRACHGTWIAHGSGDADRETADSRARLRVPPDDPQYNLRRVWLSKEQEEGYYFGFSNEGMWPLCHIAHTRPIFRSSDWKVYQEVNQQFARAVLEEMESSESPAVLVQDYHFALLPRLIKEARPDARVGIFWHIPWPNPEAFRICPWQRELLHGLLGADLAGFHIQAHCTNFLETVDRALECRIEWERFAVSRRGHLTLVRPFPISVALDEPETAPARRSPYLERAELFRKLGVTGKYLGVGVDRVDYTKGIVERFRGIERFLERWPNRRGEFVFVQIAAPSRSHIKRYNELQAEVEAEADRINWRFQTAEWKPIVLLKRHHSHAEIAPYYRAADLCMVTSLHDGMNLVAKEFVAARDDDQGALILSPFTGAARELRDALLANPYDSDDLAGAIHAALEMNPEERAARMKRMRRTVRENNIYRWAADLLNELVEIRPEAQKPVEKQAVEATSGR
jgi:alpha,alpha-trehalose-phosphate synthase [UDP-forming]